MLTCQALCINSFNPHEISPVGKILHPPPHHHRGYYCYPYFSDEETEVQRVQITFPRSKLGGRRVKDGQLDLDLNLLAWIWALNPTISGLDLPALSAFTQPSSFACAQSQPITAYDKVHTRSSAFMKTFHPGLSSLALASCDGLSFGLIMWFLVAMFQAFSA